MRFLRSLGGFFLGVLWRLLWQWEWSLPAWVLLALHFWLHISLWWFVGALLFWLVPAFLWAALVGWGRKASHDPPKPISNKNPYSHTDAFFHGNDQHTN